MAKYEYSNPFAVCFTSMKLRYQSYDSSIDNLNFLVPTDKVNVFINFESILNNLSMIRDIENKLLLERNFPIILISEAINLCAHYRKFFRGNNLDTRVFLYCTDLNSKKFPEYDYNDEYRSYYINKYTQNPKFQLLGTKLKETIIPQIQKILEFINGVYFISVNNHDGSILPYVISNKYSEYKNFIITCDKFDTQYYHENNFSVHFIKKSPGGTIIFDNFKSYLMALSKENSEDNIDSPVFQNSSFYSILLASLGDKLRSVDPLKGVGCKTILKYVSNGIKNGLITDQTISPEMIAKIFPYEQQEKLIENFHCVDLSRKKKSLNENDIFNILSQVQDRFDYNSLLELNRTEFKDYPLMLPELTC